MKNDLPSHLPCPRCDADFAIVGSAGFGLDTREACDVLESRCAGYGYREDEGQRLANGFQEEEPASKYFYKIPDNESL